MKQKKLFKKIIMLAIIMLSTSVFAQERAVTGTVTDSKSQPLPGVSIVIKGTTTGVSSDFDGNYSIGVSLGDVLVFSYVGFITKEITLGNQITVDVQLEEDVSLLDEIVLIGYGTQKKSSLTASVASIDAEGLNNRATHDAATALEARATGIQVLTQGGIAGSEASVVIRGVSSFGATDPLFIIDGAFSTSGLRSLNPADIKSMEVLKDGAAAAIYGSRAANGVVIVTTNRGKSGEPRVTISTSLGVQTPSKTLDYLNADQWRSFSQQVAENSAAPGVSPSYALEDVSPNYSSGVNTDWQDLWINNAIIYKTDVSISGGGENTNYLLSLGHLNQEGITAFSNFEKYNLRLNTGFTKGKLRVNQNIGLSLSNNEPTKGYSSGFELPTVPVRDADGNLVSAGSDFYVENESANGYLEAARADQNIGTFDVTGGIDVSYEILKGLTYKIALSGSFNSERDFDHRHVSNTDVLGVNGTISFLENNKPTYTENLTRQFDYTIDNLLSYNIEIGAHDINLLAGISRFSENLRFSGSDVIFGESYHDNLTTPDSAESVSATGLEFNSILSSVFGRINYAFDSKYLFSASVRRDKSSKFSSENNNNVGVFPAVSAGWNIHKENFFPEDGIISKLKLRASYGELGGNFIDPYDYISIAYGPIPAIFGDAQNSSEDRVTGTIGQLKDADLTWETQETVDFGVELGFLNNALNVSADYFRKRQYDVLAPTVLAPSVGQTIIINEGTVPFVNSASIENKGFEFLVDYKNRKNEFKYSVSANLSTVKNKVLALGENVTPIVGALMSGSFNDRPSLTDVGLPVGSFYGYITEGIDGEGNFIFKDTDGVAGIDDNDKVVLGDPYADFTYGLNFNAEYKDFDFTLFFQGQQGGDIFSQIKYVNTFLYDSNVTTAALDSWTPTNTNASLPIAKTDNRSGGNALPSDFYIEDASYLRLKTLQVGYNFSQDTLDKLKINNLRAYLSVDNLFTISSYSGYDPQVSSDTQFNRGVDFNAYPNTRTFTFGLNLSL